MQVGGYYERLQGLTLATVRDAGHMVWGRSLPAAWLCNMVSKAALSTMVYQGMLVHWHAQSVWRFVPEVCGGRCLSVKHAHARRCPTRSRRGRHTSSGNGSRTPQLRPTPRLQQISCSEGAMRPLLSFAGCAGLSSWFLIGQFFVQINPFGGCFCWCEAPC